MLGHSTTIATFDGDSDDNNNDNTKNNDVVIALQGDPVDCDEFFAILQRVELQHRASFGVSMGIKSLAYFGSKIIASSLRKRQMNVNCFIGGWCSKSASNEGDVGGAPALFYLDCVGALQEVKYGCHGKEMPLILSLLDRKNMEIKEGI